MKYIRHYIQLLLFGIKEICAERVRAVGCVVAFSSFLLGAVVILGWYIHSPVLVQISPHLVPMQYNTALGFLLAGVGFFALIQKRQKVAIAAGASCALIGVLTLIEYILGVNLGIDQLFMEHYITVETSHPGRMAPNTALCFSLVGIAICIYFFAGKIIVFRALSALVLILGAVAIVGYLSTLETAYGWMNLTRMALHTAVGFVLLGVGTFYYSFIGNVLRYKTLSAIWPSAMAFITFFFLSIALWQQLEKQEEKLLESILKEESQLITSAIKEELTGIAVALQRMAQRWEVQKGTAKKHWQSDAEHYVDDFVPLTAVQWVDKNYRVRWIEPLQGNEKAKGLDVKFNEERKAALQGARERNKITFTLPIDLVQGYRAFLSYVPIYIKEFEGFIVGVYSPELLLKKILPTTKEGLLHIQIYDGNQLVFQNSDRSAVNDASFIQREIELFNRTWTLKFSANTALYGTHRSALPEVALFIGFLFSLLVAVAVYANIISRQRSKLLSHTSQELIDSEERHRAVVENAMDGIIAIDEQGIIQRYNPACESIFGYQAKEVLGKSIELLMPSAEAERHNNYLMQHKKSGIARMAGARREVRAKRENGEVFPISLSVSEVKISGHVFTLTIVRDVTEEKEAKAKLEASNKKLTSANRLNEAIMSSARHLIISTDPQGKVFSFNQAAEKALGYRARDLIGKKTPALWHDENKVKVRAEELSKELGKTVEPGFDVFVMKAREGAIETREWTFIRKDKTSFPVSLTVSAMRGNKEEIIGYLGVIEDITERKQADKEREALIDKLQQSNKELDQFAYAASHDLKAPLRVIDNASRWLEEDLPELDEECRENMALLRGRTARMERLLDDLLEYSRIGRKMGSQYEELVSGDELLDDVLALLSPSKKFKIKLDKHLSDIKLNRMPLQQIFLNLIGNALKHHDKNKGVIEVQVKDLRGMYEFSVSDDGPGIAEAFQKKVFEMFQTLQPRDKVEGSGMGLAMVKKHIEHYGGVLELESEEGKGCVFRFSWPKCQINISEKDM